MNCWTDKFKKATYEWLLTHDTSATISSLGRHGRTCRPDTGQGIVSLHRAKAGCTVVASTAVHLQSQFEQSNNEIIKWNNLTFDFMEA